MYSELRGWKRWLLAALAGSLILSMAVVDTVMLSVGQAQAAPMLQDEEDLGACANLNEEDLRGELNVIAQQIFAADENGIDLEAMVDEAWQELGMDRLIDRQVDAAIAQVRRDEETLDKFLSGWSPDKAEDLTYLVAESVFDSEEFRQAIEKLSIRIAAQIEARIGELAAESVAVNLLCLRQFVDRHYSDAVVTAFANDISQSTAATDLVTANDLENGIMSVIDLHKTALGGVGVIIATQITRRIAVRIARRLSKRVAGRITLRILGRVGTEVIPLVGWIVGTGLIIYDVIESLDGALPQIQDSLKEEEVKAAIREEIVASAEPELRQGMPLLAREIANDLYGEWLDFKRKHRQVLALAEENPAFAETLAQADDLGQVAELVDVALGSVGRKALEQAIDDGSFAALLALPPAAAVILADSGSFQTTLAWGELAGPDLDRVVESDLYQYQDPTALNRALLGELLDVDDPVVIAKLGGLDQPSIAILLDVSTASLDELAYNLTPDELAQLAAALDGMDQAGRNQLVTAVVADPEVVAMLTRPEMQRYIQSGRDLSAAIAFLNGSGDAGGYVNDLFRLATRRVTLDLFAAKYGWPLTIMAILGPIVVALALASALLGYIFRPIAGAIGLFGGRRRS
jgi:hypothetical protein